MLIPVNKLPGLGMTFQVNDCPTPATQTVASLPAPAAGQGEGIELEAFERPFDVMCDSQAGCLP